MSRLLNTVRLSFQKQPELQQTTLMRALGGRCFRLARRVARGNRRQAIYNAIAEAPISSEFLRAALRHARSAVPFYQSEAYGCLDVGDLDPAPILTKDTIRANIDNFTARDTTKDSYYLNSSGGSTGAPVTVYQDTLYKDWLSATEEYFCRQFLQVDMLCVPKLILWGSERDVFGQTEGLPARLRNWLTQSTFVNSFRLSDADLRRTVDLINRIQPVVVKGYAGSLHMLARLVLQEQLAIATPRCLYSSAEVLSDSMRSTIEQAFKAPVRNFYGSREVGAIAGECAAGSLHVFSFHNHVEILDESGCAVTEGEQGRVVITTLHNRVMPLIRYEIGDLAIRGGPCWCGNPLPTLGKVIGRTTDHFLAPDGSKIHGEFFTHLFYFRPWVSEFQVIQEAIDRVRVLYVAETHAPQADMEDVARKIRHVMGPLCAVEWERVSSIPRTAQGKFTYTRSRLVC